jgi:dTDP-4-dehydrorhamnose reductase
MKIWIAGGGGLLGKALSYLCEKQKLGCIATTHGQLDIADPEMVKRFVDKATPTHIVNCAAYTDVDGAEKNPEHAFEVNAEGAENLAHAAREINAKLVHVSTNFVFDGLKNAPYVETDACRPLGIYAKSKWEGEQRVLGVLPSACIIRTSWLFGKGGKNFISSLIGLLKKQQEMRIVEDQMASLTFCGDLAAAILSLICHSGVFHFANRGECSRYQIAEEIYKEIKARGIALACERIIPVPSSTFPAPAQRPAYSVLNTCKIEAVLGKSPRSWTEVLKEYLHAEAHA